MLDKTEDHNCMFTKKQKEQQTPTFGLFSIEKSATHPFQHVIIIVGRPVWRIQKSIQDLFDNKLFSF